jgi:hypothetical protein
MKETLAGILAACAALACSSPNTPTSTTSTTATSTTATGAATDASALYARFQPEVSVAIEGTTVVLRSNGTPTHASPYWGAGHSLYESPSGGMQVNPHRIVGQSLVLRVPRSPATAAASDTPLGPMGMALNGVALFNQYAAGRSPLGMEILSFDRFNGHPAPGGQYHHHVEPLWLTTANGPASLIGVLLDGFPVYGPREIDGSTPSGLDSCNGHVHATAEIPAGIYHYHVVPAAPYISGCYRGTPGTLG